MGVGVILFIYNYFLGGWAGGGIQARVQEFVRGGAQNLKAFFFFFFFNFSGGGPAQKLAEKMTFSTKKVAKHRRNSLIFALMTLFFFFFFFCFSISRGGGAGPLGPPLDTRLGLFWGMPQLKYIVSDK